MQRQYEIFTLEGSGQRDPWIFNVGTPELPSTRLRTPAV
jgi:hypothetical protein